MIKYIAVATVAYMIYAGVFRVSFSSDEVGVGFNPSKVATRFVSEVSTIFESVK